MYQNLQRIKAAAEGLLCISETEALFQPVYLEEVDQIENSLLELAGKPIGTPVEVTTVEQFFNPMLKLYPNSSPDQRHTAQRFKELQVALQEGLTDLKVYKIGKITIQVFIVSRVKDNDYAGLSTYVVQT